MLRSTGATWLPRGAARLSIAAARLPKRRKAVAVSATRLRMGATRLPVGAMSLAASATERSGTAWAILCRVSADRDTSR
jgi:hypothetical protein